MLYAPSVPLPRVIFPALVGTTTASRNALRLASPAARMPPRHDDEEGDPTTVLLPLPLPPPPPPHDVLAIYARTHARTHAHTWPLARARARARVRMAGSRVSQSFKDRERVRSWYARISRENTRRQPFSQARSATRGKFGLRLRGRGVADLADRSTNSAPGVKPKASSAATRETRR